MLQHNAEYYRQKKQEGGGGSVMDEDVKKLTGSTAGGLKDDDAQFQVLDRGEWHCIRERGAHETLQKLANQMNGNEHLVVGGATYTVEKSGGITSEKPNEATGAGGTTYSVGKPKFHMVRVGKDAKYQLRFKNDHKNREARELMEVVQSMFWLGVQHSKMLVILKELMPDVFVSYLANEAGIFDNERQVIVKLLQQSGAFKLHPVMLNVIMDDEMLSKRYLWNEEILQFFSDDCSTKYPKLANEEDGGVKGRPYMDLVKLCLQLRDVNPGDQIKARNTLLAERAAKFAAMDQEIFGGGAGPGDKKLLSGMRATMSAVATRPREFSVDGPKEGYKKRLTDTRQSIDLVLAAFENSLTDKEESRRGKLWRFFCKSMNASAQAVSMNEKVTRRAQKKASCPAEPAASELDRRLHRRARPSCARQRGSGHLGVVGVMHAALWRSGHVPVVLPCVRRPPRRAPLTSAGGGRVRRTKMASLGTFTTSLSCTSRRWRAQGRPSSTSFTGWSRPSPR